MEKLEHVFVYFGLIRVGCSCGWRFYHETLKGKTNEQIEADCQAAYDKHIREFRK